MKLWVKAILIFAVAALAVAYAILFITYVKPNRDIVRNRREMMNKSRI